MFLGHAASSRVSVGEGRACCVRNLARNSVISRFADVAPASPPSCVKQFSTEAPSLREIFPDRIERIVRIPRTKRACFSVISHAVAFHPRPQAARSAVSSRLWESMGGRLSPAADNQTETWKTIEPRFAGIGNVRPSSRNVYKMKVRFSFCKKSAAGKGYLPFDTGLFPGDVSDFGGGNRVCG